MSKSQVVCVVLDRVWTGSSVRVYTPQQITLESICQLCSEERPGESTEGRSCTNVDICHITEDIPGQSIQPQHEGLIKIRASGLPGLDVTKPADT